MTEKNIDEILEKHNEEVKRHFDVVAEDLKEDIKTVSAQTAANTEKLEEHNKRFDRIEGDLGQIKDDIAIIKLDIEFIKNELKQKVNRDEFAALEKRVSMLEAKQK